MPRISSDQKGDDTFLLRQWIQKKESELNIVATYNLLFNASMLVEEGLGYALCYDGIINTDGSCLCFRPFAPKLSARSFTYGKIPDFFKGIENIHGVLTKESREILP